MPDEPADRLKTMSVRGLLHAYDAANRMNTCRAVREELERRCAPPAAPAGVPEAVISAAKVWLHDHPIVLEASDMNSLTMARFILQLADPTART